MGIEIPDLFLDFMSCHGFMKNKDSVVLLKFPKRIFEYYLSKGFIHLDCDKINLEKLPYEVKYRIVAEVTDDSDKFMIYSTTIPSASNTLKNLFVKKPWNYNKFINRYGIPIPNMLL